MIANPELEPEAYDVTCRVCDWGVENVSPTIAAVQMVTHSDNHTNVGAPYFAMRVREGVLGRDPDNPIRTADDGWNRSPRLEGWQ